LERPIRRNGFAAWGNLGRVLMPAAAIAVVIAVFAATTGAQTRPEFNYQNTGAADGSVTVDSLPTVAGNDPTSAQDSAVTTVDVNPDPNGPGSPLPRPVGRNPRLMLVGDSVSHDLGDGMGRQRAQFQVDIGNSAMFKCTLGRQYGDWRRIQDPATGAWVLDKENPVCRDWETKWAQDVAAFKPDAVFFLFGGPAQGTLNLGGDNWVTPCSDEYRAYQRQEVEVAIQVLTARGAVLYLSPSPHPRFISLLPDIDIRTDCVNQIYRDAAAAHPGVVRILPLDKWTCPLPGGECIEYIDGVNMRQDGIHFEGAGADIAARYVLPRLFVPPSS
jgi:hypothetical protein